MRPIERIPIVLEVLPMREYITSFNILDEEGVNKVVDDIDIIKLKKFWEENPDLRLTQVLVNMNYIPNAPGLWYYTEESDWLIKNNICEPRDILFWGINFDKNMKRIPHEKVLIKTLDTAHIKAILEGEFTGNTLYITTFQKELVLRDN